MSTENKNKDPKSPNNKNTDYKSINVDDKYKMFLLNRVSSDCKKIEIECQAKLAEKVQKLSSSVEGSGDGQLTESEQSMRELDATLQNDVSLMNQSSKFAEFTESCIDKKAKFQNLLLQLRERIEATEAKQAETETVGATLPSEAMLFKIDEELKNYNEAINEMEELRSKIAEAKRKRDHNEANLAVAKTKEAELVKKADELQEYLNKLRQKRLKQMPKEEMPVEEEMQEIIGEFEIIPTQSFTSPGN